jgi:thiamine monophosphate synthase
MPGGGGGIVLTVPASSGVHPAGGQVVAKMQAMSEPGCAALGAISPAHPASARYHSAVAVCVVSAR